jgi:hypothetical protein
MFKKSRFSATSLVRLDLSEKDELPEKGYSRKNKKGNGILFNNKESTSQTKVS